MGRTETVRNHTTFGIKSSANGLPVFIVTTTKGVVTGSRIDASLTPLVVAVQGVYTEADLSPELRASFGNVSVMTALQQGLDQETCACDAAGPGEVPQKR